MKAFCDSSGARGAGGRLFQMVSPLTAKLRCLRSSPVRASFRDSSALNWGHKLRPYFALFDTLQISGEWGECMSQCFVPHLRPKSLMYWRHSAVSVV